MQEIIFEDCPVSYFPGLTYHAKQCPPARAWLDMEDGSGVNGENPSTIVWEIVHCSTGLCQLTKGEASLCVGTLFGSLVLNSFVTVTYPHSNQPLSSRLCPTTLWSSPMRNLWLSAKQSVQPTVSTNCFSTLSGSRLQILSHWFTLLLHHFIWQAEVLWQIYFLARTLVP